MTQRTITITFDEERGRGILNDNNVATWVPTAHASKIFSCGDLGCGNAHMVFYGPDGEPEYECVVNERMAENILRIAQGKEPIRDGH